MIQKPKHYNLEELVCPHVFYKFGEQGWSFLDKNQMILMDWISETLGPTFVNNYEHEYHDHPYIQFIRESIRDKKPIFEFNAPPRPDTLLSQRGLRCNICGLSYAKTQAGIIYLSGHFLGKADDFMVKSMTAENVRLWLLKNQEKIPFPIRLEKNVPWVHMDSEDNLTGEKVHLFNS